MSDPKDGGKDFRKDLQSIPPLRLAGDPGTSVASPALSNSAVAKRLQASPAGFDALETRESAVGRSTGRRGGDTLQLHSRNQGAARANNPASTAPADPAASIPYYDATALVLRAGAILDPATTAQDGQAAVTAVSYPDIYRNMLWDLWKARWGRQATAIGIGESITAPLRKQYLRTALARIAPLLTKIERESSDTSWAETVFRQHARALEARLFQARAAELINETVEQGELITPNFELDAVKGAALRGIEALDALRALATTFTRSEAKTVRDALKKMPTLDEALELRRTLRDIGIDATKLLPPERAAIEAADAIGPMTQVIFHVRGTLSLIAALDQKKDRAAISKILDRHPLAGNIARATNEMLFLARLVDGIAAVGFSMATLFAEAVNMHAPPAARRVAEGLIGGAVQIATRGKIPAARTVALLREPSSLTLTSFASRGTVFLTYMGSVTSVFQAAHGTATYALYSVDEASDPTGEKRRSALFNVAVGMAGVGGIPAVFGRAAFFSGALSAGLTIGAIITALEIRFLRDQLATFEQNFLSFGLRGAYEQIATDTAGLADQAQFLEAALHQFNAVARQASGATHASQAGFDPQGLLAATESIALRQAADTAQSLRRFVERTTIPGHNSGPTLFGPMGFPGLVRHFAPLAAVLKDLDAPPRSISEAGQILKKVVMALFLIRRAFIRYKDIHRENLASVRHGSVLLQGVHDEHP